MSLIFYNVNQLKNRNKPENQQKNGLFNLLSASSGYLFQKNQQIVQIKSNYPDELLK